jgi:hypothetical protein
MNDSRNSSLGILKLVSIPGRGKRLSPVHSVQTGSGAYPDSYTMTTRDSFPGGKAAGA